MSKMWWLLLPLAVACGGDSDDDTAGDDDDTVGDDDDDTSGLDGMALYSTHCVACHGADGEGGVAPDPMTDVIPGATLESIMTQILEGGGFMGPVNVTDEEAEAIAQYCIDTWG